MSKPKTIIHFLSILRNNGFAYRLRVLLVEQLMHHDYQYSNICVCRKALSRNSYMLRRLLVSERYGIEWGAIRWYRQGPCA